jgi:hypothetical protein
MNAAIKKLLASFCIVLHLFYPVHLSRLLYHRTRIPRPLPQAAHMSAKLLAHAQSCMEKDDHENALRFFERALALEPTNVDILDASADACIESVRPLKARRLKPRFRIDDFCVTLSRAMPSARYRCCCGPFSWHRG